MLAGAVDFFEVGAEFIQFSLDGFLLQHLGVAHDGVERRAQLVAHVGQEDALGPVGLLQRLLVAFAFGDIAGRGEHSLQLPVAIVEGGRVVGDHGFLAVPGARREFVVGHFAFAQHQLDAGLRALRVGEVVLERRADQLVTRASGERLHLLVHVGDDAARIGRDQCIDVRFNQRAGVKLLIAHALIEQHSLGFDLLACGVIGPDQEIPDDFPLLVAQRRDRDDGRKAAAHPCGCRSIRRCPRSRARP